MFQGGATDKRVTISAKYKNATLPSDTVAERATCTPLCALYVLNKSCVKQRCYGKIFLIVNQFSVSS
jgi:hypothetical protein